MKNLCIEVRGIRYTLYAACLAPTPGAPDLIGLEAQAHADRQCSRLPVSREHASSQSHAVERCNGGG